jgi:flagellar motor protein MotB
MSKSCHCKKAGECEECPEWIFTFADLVMLMMGFFVILWVTKPGSTSKSRPIDDKEWIKVVAAIREAFGYIPDPKSKDPVDIEMIMKKLQKLKVNGPGESGKTQQTPHGPEGVDPEVTAIRPGKFATDGGKMIFEKADATLSPQAQKALGEIADQMRGHRNIILIKGHTSLDDFPDGATALQKMELSIKRAQAAADFLQIQKVEPDIIRVEGCSTFEPLTQRQYSQEAQILNRRVDLQDPHQPPTANPVIPQTKPAE